MMATIAENLQTLVDQKEAIKQALENQGKEPTDELSTYAGLINGLENPDLVEYCVTVDGTNTAYAQLYGEEKVTLTAGENDIRLGSSAITNSGYTEGKKDIPAYHSRYGKKYVLAENEAIIDIPEHDYKGLMVTITPFNSSVSESVAVHYASIEDSMYEAKTTTKLADITKDLENGQIKLGVTVTEKSVLRYFVVREEG